MLTPQEKAVLIEQRGRDERVLIYSNLLHDVSMKSIMETFRKSEKEVMDIFRWVSLKLTEYCFARKLPPLPCEAIAVAQRNKRALLPLLMKINLDKQTAFARILSEKVNPGNAFGMLSDMALKRQ